MCDCMLSVVFVMDITYQAQELTHQKTSHANYKCSICNVQIQPDNCFIYLGFSKQMFTFLETHFSEILKFQMEIKERHLTEPHKLTDIWDGSI